MAPLREIVKESKHLERYVLAFVIAFGIIGSSLYRTIGGPLDALAVSFFSSTAIAVALATIIIRISSLEDEYKKIRGDFDSKCTDIKVSVDRKCQNLLRDDFADVKFLHNRETFYSEVGYAVENVIKTVLNMHLDGKSPFLSEDSNIAGYIYEKY